MLSNSFYKVLATEETGVAAFNSTLLIDKQHAIFKGHFPELPIVPGVCMLQMIKELLEHRLQKTLHLTSAANIKFLALINPNENEVVTISFKYNELENGMLAADVIISDKNIIYFKINKAVYK